MMDYEIGIAAFIVTAFNNKVNNCNKVIVEFDMRFLVNFLIKRIRL